jgi:hypothetical protein
MEVTFGGTQIIDGIQQIGFARAVCPEYAYYLVGHYLRKFFPIFEVIQGDFLKLNVLGE